MLQVPWLDMDVLLHVTNGTSCDTKSGGVFNDWLLGILALGTFLSFTPTWYKMIATRSNVGISVPTMLILNLNNAATTLGLLFLNWSSLQCCRDAWGFTDCLIGINPIILGAAGLLGSFPLYAMAVWWCERTYNGYGPIAQVDVEGQDRGGDARRHRGANAHTDAVGSTSPSASADSTRTRSALTLPEVASVQVYYPTSRAAACGGMLGYVFLVLIDVGAGLLLLGRYGAGSTEVNTYAQANNVAAAIFISFCWLPQIHHTYLLQDSGNLSILMLLIQAPGSAIVVVSLLLDHQDLTTTFAKLVSMCAQGVLLVMCVVYELRRRRAVAAEETGHTAQGGAHADSDDSGNDATRRPTTHDEDVGTSSTSFIESGGAGSGAGTGTGGSTTSAATATSSSTCGDWHVCNLEGAHMDAQRQTLKP